MRLVLTTLSLLLLTTATALAQTPDEIGGVGAETGHREIITIDLDAACTRLSPGRTVQLHLADNASVTGHFAGWDGDRFYLLRNDKRAGFRSEDILAVWTRERATGTGLLAGAVLGSVGGGTFAGLMAYVLDNSSEGHAPYLPLILGGMIAGGAGGALIGAGVGSALPDWQLVYATPGANLERPTDQPGVTDSGSGIGHFSFLAGAARNMGVAHEHADFAWRLSLLADTNRQFSYGVEMGRYMTGAAHRPSAPWPEPDVSVPVWHAGGVAHLDLLSGPVAPFISAGLAYYDWNDSFLGYNAGAGLRIRLGRDAAWISEYRYHANLQRLTETEPQMTTFLAGFSIRW